jgi:hypothetical protein
MDTMQRSDTNATCLEPVPVASRRRGGLGLTAHIWSDSCLENMIHEMWLTLKLW